MCYISGLFFIIHLGLNVFFTYVIQSIPHETCYIGQTNDLTDRVLRHNQNRNKYTKGKGPWVIIFYRTFNTRAEAVLLERKLKAFKRKDLLLAWIEKQNGLEHPD